MIVTIRNIVLTAVALLVLLAFASCSSHSSETPALPEEEYQIGFYLNVGDVAAGSRAPSDGGYIPGSAWENYLDIAGGDIRVVIYDDTDNPKPLEQLTNYTITPVSSDGIGSKRYYLSASTTADISSGKFRIMVLANWGTYPDSWELDNVYAAEYSRTPDVPLDRNNLIPFFGIRKFAVEGGIKPGGVALLEEIHLLRAMAKLEINYTPAVIYSLTSVKLYNYNKRGFCAPAGVKDMNEYVHDKWEDDYTSHTSIPELPGQVSTPVDFVKGSSENSLVLYVPEYCNTAITADNPETYIEVKIEDDLGNTYTRNIYFRYEGTEQDKSRACDVMRNYWYRFNVSKKDAEIKVDVDVVPYTSVVLKPDFGLDIINESDETNTDISH